MDPNATLAQLLEWANTEPLDDAEQEAQHAFLDLHEWLVRGGFPPDLWLGVDKDH